MPSPPGCGPQPSAGYSCGGDTNVASRDRHLTGVNTSSRRMFSGVVRLSQGMSVRSTSPSSPGMKTRCTISGRVLATRARPVLCYWIGSSSNGGYTASLPCRPRTRIWPWLLMSTGMTFQ